MPVFHGLLVIGLALPVENPRAVVDTLKALEPEKLPHFDGEVRIVIDPWASHVVEWLDSDDEGAPIAMGVELLDTDAPIGRLYTQAELDRAVDVEGRAVHLSITSTLSLEQARVAVAEGRA